MTKQCSKCHMIQSISEFYLKKNGKDGLCSRCKKCERGDALARRNKNIQKARNDFKTWALNNQDKNRIRMKKWKQNNFDRVKDYQKKYDFEYRKIPKTVNYKLSRLLRSRLYKALKGLQKTGSAVKDLGCSVNVLKNYLESKFQPGMSWDNWSSKGWHIDHITPLSSFNLKDSEELKKACHYSNLQPLWAVDNLKKSDRV